MCCIVLYMAAVVQSTVQRPWPGCWGGVVHALAHLRGTLYEVASQCCGWHYASTTMRETFTSVMQGGAAAAPPCKTVRSLRPKVRRTFNLSDERGLGMNKHSHSVSALMLRVSILILMRLQPAANT
jgi:hypothetical protein